MGPTYQAAGVVTAAIDAFATFLAGQPFYFSEIGSGATDGERVARMEKLARERGAKLWER